MNCKICTLIPIRTMSKWFIVSCNYYTEAILTNMMKCACGMQICKTATQ